ncbi:MAG TPA: DUF948 domain-containing protein [Coleofasciculaceae cyanobacterium]
MDPLFWLGLSILLVAISLTAVLVAAIPAFRELARASRSAEKLFDTLSRELPPTLEAIRLTGMEITDLKEDVSEGVQGAGRVVQQVDQSIGSVKKQAQQAQTTTRSLFAGVKAAWNTFNRLDSSQAEATRRPAATRPTASLNRLPASRTPFELQEEELQEEERAFTDSGLRAAPYSRHPHSQTAEEFPQLEQNLSEPQPLDDPSMSKRSRT